MALNENRIYFTNNKLKKRTEHNKLCIAKRITFLNQQKFKVKRGNIKQHKIVSKATILPQC